MVSRLVGFFKKSLQKRPVLTNTAIYATFYTAAELSQQSFNKYQSVPTSLLAHTFKARSEITSTQFYSLMGFPS